MECLNLDQAFLSSKMQYLFYIVLCKSKLLSNSKFSLKMIFLFLKEFEKKKSDVNILIIDLNNQNPYFLWITKLPDQNSQQF